MSWFLYVDMCFDQILSNSFHQTTTNKTRYFVSSAKIRNVCLATHTYHNMSLAGITESNRTHYRVQSVEYDTLQRYLNTAILMNSTFLRNVPRLAGFRTQARDVAMPRWLLPELLFFAMRQSNRQMSAHCPRGVLRTPMESECCSPRPVVVRLWCGSVFGCDVFNTAKYL